jgi:hypothetical protein
MGFSNTSLNRTLWFSKKTDSREFWQRLEDRNRETADFYDMLGLARYAAMEAFVR